MAVDYLYHEVCVFNIVGSLKVYYLSSHSRHAGKLDNNIDQ